MARYIDVDKLKKDLKELPEQERIEYMGIYAVINSQPTTLGILPVRSKNERSEK